MLTKKNKTIYSIIYIYIYRERERERERWIEFEFLIPKRYYLFSISNQC